MKMKLGKSVTVHCGKIQAVTALCQFQCAMAEACAVALDGLFVEFRLLKWSVW